MPEVSELLRNNWAVVAVLAAIAFAFWLARMTVPEGAPPYRKRGSLFTEAEALFLSTLQAAVGGSWTVFARVPLSDLVAVPDNAPSARFWREKLAKRQIDIVICDSDTFEPVLAIEFDGDSRDSRSFLRGVLTAAGLKLSYVSLEEEYTRGALRKQIDEVLGLKKKR